MNDIDFIKWLCDKAEGFSIEKRFYPDGLGTVYKHDHEQINEDYKESISWDLLLQRAIEGVNKENGDNVILQGNFGVQVLSFRYTDAPQFEDISDQAKESALKYIYEQEKK